jgi:hypothetical protein
VVSTERAISARTAGVVRAFGWMACISASRQGSRGRSAQSARPVPPAQNEPDPNNVPLPNRLALFWRNERGRIPFASDW